MFSLQLVFKSSLALLVFLVLPSASVVVAQQPDDIENATPRMTSDDDNNTDSSLLLMTNYNALREEGQGFYLGEASVRFEKPESVPIPVVLLFWWCDLEFSSDDATSNYGYVGRALSYKLGDTLEEIVAQGGQSPPSKTRALSVSAVLVPTLGIFEGQFHATHDDWVYRYWDDGSSTLPILGWEGSDEGDTSLNAETSAWSASGTMTKITSEAAAKLLGMDVDDMTPALCSTEYEAAWNASHVPDQIDTSVIELEENVAQLQAENKELLSRTVAIDTNVTSIEEKLMLRVASIEESLVASEEEVAQLRADNKEIMSRMAAMEGSLTANGSGDGGDPTSTASIPSMAWYEHATMDVVVKSIMTIAVIIGVVAVDFI